MKSRKLFQLLRAISHYVLHVLTGIFFYNYVVKQYFPEADFLALAILGSLLPDIDHFLYFFIYGRKKEYTQIAKNILHEDGWRAVLRYFKNNHKKQTGLVSHNLLTVVTLGLFTFLSLSEGNPRSFVLSGSMTIHFLLDIVDDFFYLGGLNPNWYLKFGKEPKIKKKKIKIAPVDQWS